jgi:cytochrome c556
MLGAFGGGPEAAADGGGDGNFFEQMMKEMGGMTGDNNEMPPVDMDKMKEASKMFEECITNI